MIASRAAKPRIIRLPVCRRMLASRCVSQRIDAVIRRRLSVFVPFPAGGLQVSEQLGKKTPLHNSIMPESAFAA